MGAHQLLRGDTRLLHTRPRRRAALAPCRAAVVPLPSSESIPPSRSKPPAGCGTSQQRSRFSIHTLPSSRKPPPPAAPKRPPSTGRAAPKRGAPAREPARRARPPPPPPPQLVTLLHAPSGFELPCLLRRSLALASTGEPRALLTPLDAPAALLRSKLLASDDEEYEDVEAEELDALFPAAAAAALTQRCLLLTRVPPGLGPSLVVRGSMPYNEAEIITLEEGPEDGMPPGSEALGLDLLSFTDKGVEYLLYAPVDPIVLVARPMDGRTDVFEPAFEEGDGKKDASLAAALDSLQEEIDEKARDL